MNTNISNDHTYYQGCQGYDQQGSMINYWTTGNDQQYHHTLNYAVEEWNVPQTTPIVNSYGQHSLESSPLDGQVVAQNYNQIQQHSVNVWKQEDHRYNDNQWQSLNNFSLQNSSMANIGQYGNGNNYGSNIEGSFPSNYFQPPPQFQNMAQDLPQVSSTTPNMASKSTKFYNAIKNKRPQLKMKTGRKKRCSADEPIPYAKKDEENNFVCEFEHCGFVANRRSNMTRHIGAMHEPHYIICCHRLFPTKTHFEVHRLQVHEDGTFACIIQDCTRKFNRKALLHKHEERYHCFDGKSSFISCSVCWAILPHPEKDKKEVFRHAVIHSSSVKT